MLYFQHMEAKKIVSWRQSFTHTKDFYSLMIMVVTNKNIFLSQRDSSKWNWKTLTNKWKLPLTEGLQQERFRCSLKKTSLSLLKNLLCLSYKFYIACIKISVSALRKKITLLCVKFFFTPFALLRIGFSFSKKNYICALLRFTYYITFFQQATKHE